MSERPDSPCSKTAAAAELNQRIDMSEKTKPELMQWDRAGGHYMHTEYEMRQAIDPLQKRISFLEAQLEKGKQLCREQTATIVDRTKTVLDLEAQLAYAKALADSEGSRAVEYQREARSLRAQRRWNIEEDGNDLRICFDQHEKGDKCEYVRYSEAQQQPRERREQLASGQGPVKVEQIAELVRTHLTSVYACTRVWSAWQVGTMTEDDFIPASEIEMADEIAEAVFALSPSPAPAQQPLSDAQILDFGPGQPDAIWSYEDQMYFAREIEAAHGIKEKP
jgi:hypothetical protein